MCRKPSCRKSLPSLYRKALETGAARVVARAVSEIVSPSFHRMLDSRSFSAGDMTPSYCATISRTLGEVAENLVAIVLVWALGLLD